MQKKRRILRGVGATETLIARNGQLRSVHSAPQSWLLSLSLTNKQMCDEVSDAFYGMQDFSVTVTNVGSEDRYQSIYLVSDGYSALERLQRVHLCIELHGGMNYSCCTDAQQCLGDLDKVLHYVARRKHGKDVSVELDCSHLVQSDQARFLKIIDHDLAKPLTTALCDTKDAKLAISVYSKLKNDLKRADLPDFPW